jgi:hypothetical protein
MRLEDPRPSNTETTRSGFPFSELSIAPVRGDTEIYSEPLDPTHSANDLAYSISGKLALFAVLYLNNNILKNVKMLKY